LNKYAPHLYVIPEDDANRQVADGFTLHHHVKHTRMQVMPPAGGWSEVLKTFKDVYIQKLREYPLAHVVLLIDFDGSFEQRRSDFQSQIPVDIQQRVFVVGSQDTPEAMKRQLKRSFEEIGKALADDCDADTATLWGHQQLSHNDPDRHGMAQAIKPFLF